MEQQQETITALENKDGKKESSWRKDFETKRETGRRAYIERKSSLPPELPSVFNKSRRGDSQFQLPKKRHNVTDIRSYISGQTSSGSAPVDEIILPFFCPEDRLPELENMIEQAVARGIRRFRITSLYQFHLMKKMMDQDSIELIASFPLPAANSMAAMALMSLGASRAQIWLELDKDSIEAAAENWPLEAEICRIGKPFLLATRAGLSIEGMVNDSRGKEFVVEKPVAEDLDFSKKGDPGALGFVFPAEIIVLPATKGCSDYYDISRTSGKEKETGFNYDFALI
jgi:hypothetical protein